MKIGILVTGDTSVRAAHSLAAHPSVEEVVVVGPARSKNFAVAESAEGCDYLLGAGASAPKKALGHGVPLIWDGDSPENGVAVWGANVKGLTLALASRETDPRLVAVSHPSLPEGNDQQIRFPHPIGRSEAVDGEYGGRRLAMGKSPNEFAACLAEGATRRVTIIDDAEFLAGIALAAAVDVAGETGRPVWDDSLTYLETAMAMGLAMAEGF